MRSSLTARVTAALVLGLAAGVALGAYGGERTQQIAAFVEPVGTLWVNGIRMTVLPLVVSLLVVGIARAGGRGLGRLGVRALLFFLITLSAVALLTALVTPPLYSLLRLDQEDVAALRATASSMPAVPEIGSFRDWLVSLVPVNPVKAAADGALLPLVVFFVIFAAALGRVRHAERDAAVGFFRSVAAATMVIVGWILALAPVGVLALAFTLGVNLGANALRAIGFYAGIVIGLHIVFGLALYAVAVFFGRVSLAQFARATAPAQAVGFSSRSSFAALPAMLDGATRVLRIPTDVSAFVLPLAVSTYRLTSPVYWPVGAMLVARLYGVDFGLAEVMTVAFAAVILTASAPGIPSGGLFVQAPLYTTLGLPIEGLGILIAVDAIPDMFKTAFNVTADMAAVTVVAAGAGPAASSGEEALSVRI